MVAHGINREGKRTALHLSLGVREGTESWKGVLNDLVERGLRPPQLLITDGNQGLLKAINDIWPKVPPATLCHTSHSQCSSKNTQEETG